MNHPQPTQSILFVLCLFAYVIYLCNSTTIRIGIDSNVTDETAYNLLMPTQLFDAYSNFFDWKNHYGFCERTSSKERNMIRAQMCAISHHIIHGGSSMILARQEVPPVIIPPLPKTGCEELSSPAAIQICNGNVQNVIRIAACVGAGMVLVPALFFVALTLARWIRVVRPKKNMILVENEAKRKAAGLTRSGQVLRFSPDNEAPFDGRLVLGSRMKKAKVRIEEDEVWYGGVRMTLPWGRGQNGDKAVAQLPSRGTTRGRLIGMSPNSSSIYILEPGQFDRGDRHAGQSTRAVSENARHDGIRVVSTSRDVPTERVVVSQRQPSGLAGLQNVSVGRKDIQNSDVK